MGQEVLKKFGRYFLLDRIAQGGMAEIYRARLASFEGAGRLLVIKRIQQGFGENAEFLEMFKSEIKTTMGFNHPNIVQLYDFGEENKQPYIAMEWVDGKNLRQFMNKFAEQKKRLPIDLSVFVTEQAAAGLHYAHAYKDKISGESVNIVHRDISPQNVLISFDGNVKVIDFGIAKARTNTEATRAGVIKGKPSYLAPEQIEGLALDGRSDIFSLGIVLWELLTGQKLFAAPGENEFAVLKLIENCTTYVKPPSTLNPEVPRELDLIVLKCLAKEREKRFQSAEELQRALHGFLYDFNSDFNPADLAHTLKNLYANEIVEDRKLLQRLNGQVEQLLTADIPDAPEVVTDTGPRRSGGPDITQITGAQGRAPRGQTLVDVQKTRSTRVEIEKLPAVHNRVKTSQPSPLQARQMPRPVATQAPAQRLPRAPKTGGWLRPLAAVVVVAAVVVLFGKDFGLPFFDEASRSKIQGPAPASVAKSSTTASVAETGDSARVILLKIKLLPGGGNVTMTLNGQSVDPANPSVQVPLDRSLELVVEREQFRSIRREFVLESARIGGLSEWSMDVQMEPVTFGYLTIHTTPSAQAYIRMTDANSRGLAQNDAQPWMLRTPIENEKMPVGVYQIRLVNDVLGMSKEIAVEIKDGKAVKLDERLDVDRN